MYYLKIYLKLNCEMLNFTPTQFYRVPKYKYFSRHLRKIDILLYTLKIMNILVDTFEK